MAIETDKACWHRYVDVYERAFATLGSGFDVGMLRCRCGTKRYEEADSMSALMRL